MQLIYLGLSDRKEGNIPLSSLQTEAPSSHPKKESDLHERLFDHQQEVKGV
jgi:hypothetical protein